MKEITKQSLQDRIKELTKEKKDIEELIDLYKFKLTLTTELLEEIKKRVNTQ